MFDSEVKIRKREIVAKEDIKRLMERNSSLSKGLEEEPPSSSLRGSDRCFHSVETVLFYFLTKHCKAEASAKALFPVLIIAILSFH